MYSSTAPPRGGGARNAAGATSASDDMGEWETNGGRQGRRVGTGKQKGSHAKLDLLLREVQRLNSRLDMVVGCCVGDLKEAEGEVSESKMFG